MKNSMGIRRFALTCALALLSQAAWAAGLFLAARLIWARVQRRITVQGG